MKPKLAHHDLAETLLRVIDTSNAPIVGVDRDGRVNEWNQTAARITGYEKAEVMGRDLVAEFITDDFKSSVKDVLDNALAGEQTANYEFPLYTKDGNRVDVLLNSTSRRDEVGQIVGVLGVGQDITELNQVRLERERVATDLLSLIDTANAPIFGIDANGRVNEWNQTAARITGYEKAEVMGRDLVAEFITDDFKSSVKDVLDNALAGVQTANYEFPLYTKDGNRVDVLLNSTSRRDEVGQIVGVVGVGQDITKLNQVRLERERVATDLLSLIDTANAPIFGIDANGRVNEWNQTAARITGYEKAEVMGRDLVAEFITDDFKSSVKDVLDNALAGVQTANYEFPLYTKDGNRVDVLLNSTSRRDEVGQIVGVVGVGQDITKLNQVRLERERVATDLLSLIDTANAPIFGIDANGRVNEWNQTAARITGYEKAEVMGRDLVAEFITDDFKSSVKDVLDNALAGVQTANYEFPLYTKDGNRVDVLLNSTSRRDEVGQIVGVVGVGQDITKLNQVRLERERVATDLLSLIDTANAPIFGIDANGRVNEWNQTAARITGYEKAEVMGRDLVAEFITDDFKSSVKDVLDNALAGVQTANYEFPLYTKDGNRVDVLLNSTSRRDEVGQIVGVVGVGQDITKLKAQEAKNQQAARLAAFGGLTGGIAHDFNNLLQVITGNLSLIATDDPETMEFVDEALEAARNGSKLIQSLLAFSRQQTLTPSSHNLNFLLDSFVRSLARMLGATVTFRIDVPSSLSVMVDKQQFETALLNLCLNAKDAMKKRGVITITGRYAETPCADNDNDDGASATADLKSGTEMVLIEVSDDGCGISASDLPHVTEPFYTTKATGKGSGLGLSSVSGFVEQSGGLLTIDSTPGIGTTIGLLLPSGKKTKPVDSGKLGHTKATILVVDDEPANQRLLTRWFVRSGYEVLSASDAAEAIDCIKKCDGAIDVLLSDLVMPGEMDGLELVDYVTAHYPHVVTAIATGYSEQVVKSTSQVKGSIIMLSKPYKLEDATKLIEEKLATRPNDG